MRHDSIGVSASGVLMLGDLDHAQDDSLSMEDITLLTLLGVPMVEEYRSELAQVIDRYGNSEKMPKVKDFCEFSRTICPNTDEDTGIDALLHRWFVFTTEMVFGLEKHVVGPHLDRLFANQPTIDLELFFQTAMRFPTIPLQQSRVFVGVPLGGGLPQ